MALRSARHLGAEGLGFAGGLAVAPHSFMEAMWDPNTNVINAFQSGSPC